MKIKNISSTIVNIGNTALLPDETVEITGWDDNPALDSLIRLGMLEKAKMNEPAPAPKKKSDDRA